ncbi:MAG: hypothetical protein LUM44_09775 [Pyrinomonadaceae bacterium]|nr:hypothetical protein [Pyrinomonadaceae bacterium]
MTYADKDQLIADYIPGAKSTNEIAAVERILEGVSAFVDSYCRRPSGYFSPSPDEPTMKRVRGEGHHFLRLPIHVFGSVTEVRTSYGALIKPENYYESEKNGWLYATEDGIYPEASFDLCSPDTWADGQIFKVTAR